jgi:class 3 adenylate cyclase
MATRRTTTLLLGDIVGSTELAASLGDGPWAALLERHQESVVGAIERHHGEQMDTAGDGFFAVFDSVVDAVRCADAIRVEAAAHEVKLRFGVHTGSCWTAGAKCTGLDVSIGARLAAAARPDEIVLSRAAADALAGDDRFEVQFLGVSDLKGVPGAHELYAVTTSAEHQSHLLQPHNRTRGVGP